MFNLQPGTGLGFTGSKQIALGLGGDIVEIEAPAKGGGAGTEYIQRKDLINEENEIIMAVIKAFLEKEG